MNLQESDESKIIENEISMMKFESDEVCEEIILLKLSLSRFVEICYFCFYSFRGAVPKYFDIIVIKQFGFPYFWVFCLSLCPSLNNTVISDFETTSFCVTGRKSKLFIQSISKF
jgi:hypothetical protein